MLEKKFQSINLNFEPFFQASKEQFLEILQQELQLKAQDLQRKAENDSQKLELDAAKLEQQAKIAQDKIDSNEDIAQLRANVNLDKQKQ